MREVARILGRLGSDEPITRGEAWLVYVVFMLGGSLAVWLLLCLAVWWVWP